MALTETFLENGLWFSIIAIGLSLAYNIYMVWANHKQAKVLEVLEEIRDLIKKND